MFGQTFQRYGLDEQDQGAAKDQYLRSIFSALAANAGNLHQGGLGRDMAGISIDQIAQSLYEQRQREGQLEQREQAQQFSQENSLAYREMAEQDRARAEETRQHEASMSRLAGAEAAEKQHAEEMRQADISSSWNDLMSSYDGPDKSALLARYKVDPKGAIAAVTDRMKPAKESAPEEVNWQQIQGPDGSKWQIHPRTGEKRMVFEGGDDEEKAVATRAQIISQANRLANADTDPLSGKPRATMDQYMNQAVRNYEQAGEASGDGARPLGQGEIAQLRAKITNPVQYARARDMLIALGYTPEQVVEYIGD